MAVKEHINEYFNSRGFMILSALALIVAAVVALIMGTWETASHSPGMFFSLRGTLFEPGPVAAAVNVGCLLLAGGLMLALNKVFTFVRSTTHLIASAFFWLQVAHPQGLVTLNAGTLIGLATAMATLPLFASFQDRHAQRSIFLIFAILATGTMFHYGTLVLLPAFFLGFLNMGALNLKGMLAMLFGIVTPFWIALGLGIAAPGDFVAPPIGSIWHITATPQLGLQHALAALLSITGIVLAIINLLTIMNYRMQTRVYNTFLVLTLVLAIIAMVIDYRGMAVFMPLLGLMVAVQVAHAHTLRTQQHYRFVLILLLMAVCAAFFTANLMVAP